MPGKKAAAENIACSSKGPFLLTVTLRWAIKWPRNHLADLYLSDGNSSVPQTQARLGLRWVS